MAGRQDVRPSASPSDQPIVLQVVGPLVCSDIPELCAQARTLLADVEPGHVVICDVSALGSPDRVALDALARLQLTVRRMGHVARLRHASPALKGLLARVGLCDVLPLSHESELAAQREPEHREQSGGVEERRQRDDLAP